MTDIATLLDIDKEDYKNYKLQMMRKGGTGEPLDVFARDKQEWEKWTKWRGQNDDFNRTYVICFIRFYPEGDDFWLFGGIYEIEGRGKKDDHSYKIKLTNKGEKLIGRLKIEVHY